MDTIEYFAKKFDLDLNLPSPIQLPNVDRVVMAQTIAELRFKIGAEIGVASGVHSEILCQNIPNHLLFCIDPWKKVDGFHSFNNAQLRNWKHETLIRMAKYNVIIKQKTSMEALDDFEDYSLDFVYLDGAHDFRHIAEDISEWMKKIKPNGIMYGHDFVTRPFGRYHCHVKDVVTAYANSHLIMPWFYYGNLQETRLDGRFSEIPEWVIVKINNDD